AREPDVHHLAALERPCARGAPPVVLRPSAALVPDGADDVRVPARDRPPRRRPSLLPLHAVHHPDEHRGLARLPGEDERLGATRVEPRPAATLAQLLGVEVVRGDVARLATRRPRLEAGALRRRERRPAARLTADQGEYPA